MKFFLIFCALLGFSSGLSLGNQPKASRSLRDASDNKLLGLISLGDEPKKESEYTFKEYVVPRRSGINTESRFVARSHAVGDRRKSFAATSTGTEDSVFTSVTERKSSGGRSHKKEGNRRMKGGSSHRRRGKASRNGGKASKKEGKAIRNGGNSWSDASDGSSSSYSYIRRTSGAQSTPTGYGVVNHVKVQQDPTYSLLGLGL